MFSPPVALFHRWADRAAVLPWPVGILFTLLSAAALHLATGVPVGNLWLGSEWLARHAEGWGAWFMQALPLLGLLLAALSFWGRQRRQRQLAALVRDPNTEALVRLRPREVEVLLIRLYALQGYEHSSGLDEGSQWVMWSEGEKYIFHAQQWRSLKVGVEVLRELQFLMDGIGAEGGLAFTTGAFTPAAKAYASSRAITLLDGAALQQLLRDYEAERLGPPRNVPPPSQDIRRLPPTQNLPGVRRLSLPPRPTCPQCSRPMLRRHELQGPRSGEAYWGCAGFPVCSGRRPMA